MISAKKVFSRAQREDVHGYLIAHIRPIVAMVEREVDRIEALRYNVNAVISERAIQAQWSMSYKENKDGERGSWVSGSSQY